MKIMIDTRGALVVVLDRYHVLGRFHSLKEALTFCDSMTYYNEDLDRYLTYTSALRYDAYVTLTSPI